MPFTQIPLSGGLVTSRDPSLLEKGELTRADDCEYHPNDPGLWKVDGRTEFNSSAESSGIIGARYLEFESATDRFVTHVGTTYRYATAATTGSFSNLVTGLTGGSTLDSVHWEGAHYLLNGVDRNRKVASDLTVTLHGMLANTTAPTADSSSGSGITLSSGASIQYWVEERYKSGSTVLRRNRSTSSEVVTVTGTVTDNAITITRPTVVNSDATHWALYGTATGQTFPTGFEIAEVAIATTSISDTRTGTDPAAPSGDAYEKVSITLAGAATTLAKFGPPPIASTGDVFEDSIVLNDVSDVRAVVWSFTDEPEAFPAVNVINFSTKEADEVKCIRRLGGILIVLLRDTAWRINTLPNPEDAAFQPGRVKDQIEGAHGGAGPMCAATFSFGQGIRLAYVSRYGIHVTDGYSWDDIADDIAWTDTVDVASLSSSVLINNPSKYRLEFYYTPAGGTANTEALYLNYHPSHAKSSSGGNFRAKITKRVNTAAKCAFVAVLSGESQVFTGNADGKLYLEGSGDSNESDDGAITMVIRGRDEYLNGLGGEFRLDSMALHHSAGADSQTCSLKTFVITQGNGPRELPAKAIDLTLRGLSTVTPDARGDAIQFGVENSDTSGTFRSDYILAETSSQGTVER